MAAISPILAETQTGGPAARDRFVESLFSNQQFGEMVETLKASWNRSSLGWDRRHDTQRQLTQLAKLVPLDDRTEQPTGSEITVTTRNISTGGIGISHKHPLPFKKAAITLTLPDGSRMTVIVRLLWCRFTSAGRYDSGGRFLCWRSETEPLASCAVL